VGFKYAAGINFMAKDDNRYIGRGEKDGFRLAPVFLQKGPVLLLSQRTGPF
jgi:hypothetical protein